MAHILYSGFRFSHHNFGSGYDTLVPEGADFVFGNVLPLGHYPEPSRARRFNFLIVDLLTLWRGLWHSTVHYLYPENTAYFSPAILKWLGKKIVFTVHLSESVWLEPTRSPFQAMKQWCLGKADAIVTLSSWQARIFQRSFPTKMVRYVPHGFDFERAIPSDAVFASRLQSVQVALVGQNYRDFDLLEEIVRTQGNRQITFHLIGLAPDTKRRFKNLAGVICHERLDRQTYEGLLERSTAMLLPLTFATANNAILEAYKCFLPILSSDIEGVIDYAVDRELLFRDAKGFWARFDTLCALGSEDYRQRCIDIHQTAKARFSWAAIRMTLAELY